MTVKVAVFPLNETLVVPAPLTEDLDRLPHLPGPVHEADKRAEAHVQAVQDAARNTPDVPGAACGRVSEEDSARLLVRGDLRALAIGPGEEMHDVVHAVVTL